MRVLLQVTVVVLLFFESTYGQTTINGIINSNKTLIKSESPYLVTSDLVIFPDGKLTIEPGVEILFSDNTKLEVRGTLNAIGDINDSIVFTSSQSKVKDAWVGVLVKNTQGGNANFNFCNFYYANQAIHEECCRGGNVDIKNSLFKFNTEGISGYSGVDTKVDSCFFIENLKAITQADKIIDHSFFSKNNFGLYQTERTSVYNSTFKDNYQSAIYASTGGRLVNDSIINNRTGVQFFMYGISIDSCFISNNRVGIELNDWFGSMNRSIKNSKICNNLEYNIKSNSSLNVDLTSNCWCTSDELVIQEKIFDAYDNIERGIISYDVCLITEVNTVLSMEKFDVYPSLVHDQISINNSALISRLIIYNSIGKTVYIEDEKFQSISLSFLSNGLYTVKIIGINGKQYNYKIIKQ